MADSSFFTDGGSGSGTFQTIETKIAEAEAAKVAAEAAQAGAEQAETDAQTAEAGSVAAKNTAVASSSNAAISESNSASSSANASNKASDAQKLAINPEDSQYTLSDGSTTGYSALHYGEKAADSLASATTQASNAAASAVTAGQHKDDAQSAKTAAESARDSALSALDNFEDNYLGDHSSDPTTDGDGDPLTAGSIYFNSTVNVVKVYTGSAWVVAYADGATLVAKAGDTMTGNLSFGDNNKAIFGAGDLEVYHDGSNSYVKDAGTGDLFLQGSNNVQIESAAGANMIYATAGAQVRLFYNGSPKFNTTASGIDVTGTTSTDGLTVIGAAYIQSATAPQLELAYNSGNITGFYRSGGDFQIKNDNGAGTPETSIVLAEDGAVSLYYDASAKLATTATGINVTGTVTADGLTVDTNTLHVDSTNNRAGIGTSSPADKLHVEGNIYLGASNRTIYTGGSANLIFQNNTGNMVFSRSNGSSESMRIDSSGNLLVGKTATSAAVAGMAWINNEYLQLVNTETGSGDRAFLINRQSADGTLIEFRRANTNIGSIGVASEYLYIHGTRSTDAGLMLGSQTVAPASSTGGNRDDAIDLGFSGNSFKDLYLGGTAYVGTSIGIGTTSSPAAQFEINSSGFGHRIEGVSANNLSIHRFITDTNDTDKFVIGYGASHPTVPHQIALKANNAAGTVGLYTNGSEGARLLSNRDFHVDGNVIAYSTTISDIRLKKDIAPIEDAVTKVQQLNGCTFTYLKDDRKSAGLIAQDLEKVLPSCVIEDEAVFHGEEGETYKTVQYDQVIGLLVEAVKELKQEIEELKKG